MSTQISGEVFQDALRALSDGNTPPFPQLRMGVPVGADKWDLFALQGRMYNIHETTIGTPLNTGAVDNAGIVLTAPWVRFTVPTGVTVFPRHLNIAFEADAGTLTETALIYTTSDTYTSGGTAITVRNWRTDNPQTSAVTNAYVGPSGGAIVEGTIANPRAIYQAVVPTAFGANQTDMFVVDLWWDQLIPIVGPASVILYVTGAGTAATALYSMDWAEVPTVSAVTAV